MKSAEFKKYVSKYFAPEIRKAGWKGSGFLYKKENDFPVIFLMGFQPRSSGGSFFVEYSIYFPFVNDIRSERIELKKIKYANAELWCRNSIMDNGKWFQIPESENEIKKQLQDIWETFEKVAIPEFEKSTNYIERIDEVKITRELISTPVDFPFNLSGKTRARELMTLAEIYRYKGEKNKVSELCSMAIELIGDKMVGSGLLPLLNEMKSE